MKRLERRLRRVERALEARAAVELSRARQSALEALTKEELKVLRLVVVEQEAGRDPPLWALPIWDRFEMLVQRALGENRAQRF